MIPIPHHLTRWLGRHGHFVLLGVLLVVGGTWAFIELADEVGEGDTQQFDEWALRALRQPDHPELPIGPRWMHEVGRDLTAIGGVAVLSGITFLVAGYMLMARKYHAMWLVLAATFSGLVVSTLLKHLFGRDRPDIVPHLSHVYTSSFPSGHSMLSAVVYLTLGSLLARLAPGWKIKIYFITAALLITFLVGVSRVYMGVHYPTDVLAGWTAGLVWAIICWLAARQLQRRGSVEKDTQQTQDLQHEGAIAPSYAPKP
ncbi:MAG TPA: phosphatase PAP2 family protein [Tepidisphaeraceae bacterium]|nr:phosphatase PAP2 family protein [Tepidisphaeraceae bacterium]